MAASWAFTTLLVVTIVAIFTCSQPLFQRTSSEAVEKQTQTELEIVSHADAGPSRHYPLLSKLPLPPSDEAGSTSRSTTTAWSWGILRRGAIRRQRWTRKLIGRQDQNSKVSTPNSKPRRSSSSRRSVVASFQSDRMVPTGPNPLHNSNRSQVIFP